MSARDMKRYGTYWLLGWPDDVHRSSDLAQVDIARRVRRGLELTPQMLRLAWRHRRDVHLRAKHEAAQRLALYFCGGNCETYASYLLTATQRWSLEKCVLAMRQARRQATNAHYDGQRFAPTIARHRAMILEPQEEDESRTAELLARCIDTSVDRVRIHTYRSLDRSSRSDAKARDRDALRTALCEPITLAGPKDRHKCDEVFAQLYLESPWLAEALTYLWRAARVNVEKSGTFVLPPLVLAGPPGCGKTHLAERLGEVSGCAPLRLDMSSITASFIVTGAEYTWASASAGRPIEHIAETQIANPIVILDEIDKRAHGANGGDAATALLPLLERSTAAAYQSPYLEAPVDLSHVSWILCVNDVACLPRPLRDRVRVVQCPMPEGAHLRDLVARILGEDVDPAILETATDAVAGGRSLRWLSRLADQLRAIADAPVLH
ncbi:ATPase family associated with various cellular activities (AAA) [Roseivivax halotolerans]|uniref:ATPase family associated with various cellular activities (AAA) n=1 Tax=Roseivivax halotolerans TaxID=93684 RepID=A0A1I6A2C3_9RHOB|nr:AAA family ATPase [Roseivivax halotolerans]SFQ62770.1 ATPase family associated with various cellular activities (AAA) [Roseivivax halotolerans]